MNPESVLAIMKQVFGVEQLDTTASQRNCEQWDSLRHLNLVAELEEAFDIELEPEEIAQMTDFDHVMAVLNTKA